MMAKRRLNKRQTNNVLAGSMGFALALAVAFFVVAMPAHIFESFVSASMLPAILPAAQPPLGETARLIVAAIAGCLAGGGVVALFLFTDRPAEKKPETVRPFFANSEIDGLEPTPAPEFVPVAVHSDPMMVAVDPPAAVPEEIADLKPIMPDMNEEPIFLDFRAFRTASPPANDPPLDLGAWKLAEAVPASEPESKPAAVVKPAAVSKPITAPAAQAEEEPISALMQRLEAGLERRSRKGIKAGERPTINKSSAGLRSTLDELRKMAVRR